MYTKIKDLIKSLPTDSISEERKELLQTLSEYIQSKLTNNQEIRLNFICTHNSRRSHLSQVWAQAIAYYYNINNVFCYSGGTEATAMFHMAAKTLVNQGFAITQISEGENPIQSIKYAQDKHAIIGFSKTFDDTFNPQSGFVAIMTCSSADKGCPFIAGAEKRIPMTFEDPKAFDNTPQQAEKYEERSVQIATELKYVFSLIKVC
ncbi:arsenate-mycothiol transferase ArsC [Aquimarina agarilytica]|uniref:arsenate-mycothiol transferase ArsC n=1 Tax=Aquimarina agarilytica TaxID=1087449 RepID=UPI00028985FE|nr:protein-tyrosine-phosphatase [Aquimarina agarilytica]